MKHFDPVNCPDWQIAAAAEKEMIPFEQMGRDLGLNEDELIPHGRYLGKVDFRKAINRLGNGQKAKYVDVTAITPTPLGEGKTTTAIGLVQGLGRIGHKAVGTIRQPSGGPTFNIKGSAAGGGLSQCIPLTPFSLGLTGDIDAITNAHNLAMVALTSRMQHEFNYSDERLAKSNIKRLDIDSEQVFFKWAMDFCAQSLRNIVIGKGGKMDGFEMNSGFQISVSSELMAILSVSTSLKDMRERISRVVMACDKKGNELTAADFEVDGAMAAWMVNAINPNLLQTLEGQPVFVHAGPFANIAIGQSSIVADNLASRLSDYVITESGFGADIGFEKFVDLKCRYSGLKPDAVVIVATIRALKMHGGGPKVKPGAPLASEYTDENLSLLEAGCANLDAHIETVRKSGLRPVVCLNAFHTDTPNERKLLKKRAESAGAYFAMSNHWQKGGEGAEELAEAVAQACNESSEFKFLYNLNSPLGERIDTIAREVYGADGVSYSDLAKYKLERLEADPKTKELGTCMVKTHLSLSHDPDRKGRPKDWILPIRDILTYRGAGFVTPMAGSVKLLPGTASNPAFRNIDIDAETGEVTGII